MREEYSYHLTAGAMLLLLCLSLIGFANQGCSTTQKKVVYQSLYTTEMAVLKTYSAYNDLVVAGKVDKSTLRPVADAYAKYQAAFLTALDAAQFNPDAAVPDQVKVLADDVTNLIILFTSFRKQ
jgi:hypothetical protein